MASADSILILGGGPAGMAAAMELSNVGVPCTIVERADEVGGLAKTIVIERPEGTYRTDIGPHRFFSKNKYLYGFIEDLLGEEWITVKRLTRFHVGGKYYYYPIRFRNALSQMGIARAIRVLLDFASEKVRAIVNPRPMNSFEDYAVANFGRTLAEFNMLSYTSKIWGLPCREISIDWALQRIGGLSVWSAIKHVLVAGRAPRTLADEFFYPQFGSGTIYRTIAQRVVDRGSVVHTNSEPTRIRHDGVRVREVDVATGNETQTYAPDAVVCSIPVSRAIALFDPPAPPAVREAAQALRFRAQVYLFLTINRERVSHDNWVYFPDADIPFGRYAEMKNFSESMSPAGKTSLFIEYFCFEDDAIWTMEQNALFDLTMKHLTKLGVLNRDDVLSVHHFKQSHVYPVYDLKYKARVELVLAWLDSFENFTAVGRPGRFRYTNQDHSLEMGILAARAIIDGTRYNADHVGAEREYFERGYSPARITRNAV